MWVWRGDGIPAEIKELDSFDTYTWTRLDLSKPADKSLLAQYWEGLEEGSVVDGLKAQEVKYFK